MNNKINIKTWVKDSALILIGLVLIAAEKIAVFSIWLIRNTKTISLIFLRKIPRYLRFPIAFISSYFLIILFFSVGYLVAGLEVDVEIMESNVSRKANWFECIYFSFVTITTLGYGDITPEGWKQQSLSGLQSVIGVMSIGTFFLIAGYLLNNFVLSKIERRTEEFRKRSLVGFYYRLAKLFVSYMASYNHHSEISVKEYLYSNGRNVEVPNNFHFNESRYTEICQGTIFGASRITPTTYGEVFRNSTKNLANSISEELDRYRPQIMSTEEINRIENTIKEAERVGNSAASNMQLASIPGVNLAENTNWINAMNEIALWLNKINHECRNILPPQVDRLLDLNDVADFKNKENGVLRFRSKITEYFSL